MKFGFTGRVHNTGLRISWLLNTTVCITNLLAPNCCSLLWTLTSSTVFPHLWWSLATACLFFIHVTCKSSSSSSLHLLCSLPLSIVPLIVAGAICFGIPSMWPHPQSWRDFINFTIFSPCHMSPISLFVRILQHSHYFVGPRITHTTFLSSTLSMFMFVSSVITVQVWTVGQYGSY